MILKGKKRGYEIDMTNGPLIGKMLSFTVPVMISGILQLFFNAADVIVVGRFTGKTALAAVGSTGSLINLLIGLFMGLSVGSNVLVARFYGAGDGKSVSDTVHTSVAVGLIGGVILEIIGLFAAKPLLILMDTPEDVIEQSVLYMRIIFMGVPLSLLYNFGASILRAVGDTKRPLYYLTVSGILNVILNFLLVTVVKLGVAGVAIATIISQALSCTLTLLCLKNENSSIKLYFSKIKVHTKYLAGILKIGLPAGLQGCIFSISNVLIQSSVNSFGSTVMAGSTAASNIEGFVYVAMNAVYQTNLSFTSQNFGAGKVDRIKKILRNSIIIVIAIGLFFGGSAYIFGNTLIGIYNNDAEVIKYGVMRLGVTCTLYFFCGLMEVMVGTMRGIGYSVLPMIVSLAGACGLRIIWIYTVFAFYRSIPLLFISYPISWFVTSLCHFICYLAVSEKAFKKAGAV